MANKVLVVDDEKLIVKGIKFSLEQDGMEVTAAYDGKEAYELAMQNDYDIILLDVMLPELNGFEVCQMIREKSDVPIIMLTAKGDDMDKILGLEYGADDYITKPFNILEVKARIKAIMRRTKKQEQEDEKEAEITISVDEATPVDLDSYVQIQPVSSKASSELDDNTAEKAIDGQEVTSWQEDVAGYGQGENLTLKFEKTYTVKYLALKLGSWEDDAAYEQNNRPKELDIQTDHFIRKVTFSDEKKEYWVTFSDTCKTSELKLIIEQVYRGLKTNWNDTCIAEVQVYGTEE